MELMLDKNAPQNYIQRFETGQFVIANQLYTQSLIVTATQLILWKPTCFTELTQEDLLEILSLQPSLVILGTGDKQIFPNSKLLIPFAEQSLGVEIMNTAAACRTFNILTSEGRNVAAGLLVR